MRIISTLAIAAAAAMVLTAPTANALTVETNGAGSILGGNQVSAPINAPITVCGIAVGILGSASATCHANTVSVKVGDSR